MGRDQFEWNKESVAESVLRYALLFEEAQTAFLDPHALVTFDPDFSSDRENFVLLGMGAQPRLVVVCFSKREGDDVIRIRGARKATRDEQQAYADEQ